MIFGQGESESLNTQVSSAAPTGSAGEQVSTLGFQLQDLLQTRPGPGTDSGVLQGLHTLQSFSLSLSPCSPLQLATEGHPCLNDARSGKKQKKFTAVH